MAPRKNRLSNSNPSGAKDLAERAVALFQPRTTRQLGPEDGREMVANLGGFLGVLAGWKRREREEEAAARAAGGAR